jgi:photosystem II stability/assembly factor-like uncharacterized protein
VIQAPLFKIQFINQGTGWAMGEDGEILRTTDGGDHWLGKAIPTKGGLRALYFSDALNGWVVGSEGEAYRTTDGGETWKQRGPRTAIPNWRNRTATFVSVRFINSRLGFIGAHVVPKKEGGSPQQGILLKTEDGGASWSSILVSPDEALFRAQILSPAEISVVAGFGEKLFHTLDGGRSWMISKPVSDGGAVTIVCFTSPNFGWLVVSYGMYYDKLLYTSDGGRTWINTKLEGAIAAPTR